MKYSNHLRIKQRGKGIPYFGNGEMREDGDANYGFKNLKGRPDLLDQIPELIRDLALYNLVSAINLPSTGLFTVGCTSGFVADGNGHRISGYVEFAFNSVRGVSDAAHYFPVFFHFDKALYENKFDLDMHFGWELEGAIFTQTDTAGFTAAVFLNTGYHQNSEDARETWELSLDLFGQYLSSVPPDGGQPLFE